MGPSPTTDRSSIDTSNRTSNVLPGSRRLSFNLTATSGRRGQPVDACQSSAASFNSGATLGESPQVVSPTRVHFTYRDEETRARICKNAQALVDGLQRDRSSMAVNAQVARKALHYRRLMDRFCDLDPDEPNVDISAFLGIEWHHVEAQGSPESPVSSETSSSMSSEDDEGRAEKDESQNEFMLEL